MSDGNLSSGGGDGENTDGDNPIRDYGTRVRSGVDLDEIEGKLTFYAIDLDLHFIIFVEYF